MIADECRDLQEELTAMRRQLHRIPEQGLDLPQTREYVVSKLCELGIPFELSDKDSSVVGHIKGARPGRTVALRADMDALPIKEQTGLAFSSVHEGAMHACGHDAHMAMLLGAAKILASRRDELAGEVRLLFQTGEEMSKGALIMIGNGALEGVDAVFGTHIGTLLDKDIPSGRFIITPGPVMASFDRFTIKVRGRACHGSTPEKGVDPINIAAHIVIALQTINAREFNACVPVVVTIGRICGGVAYNAIPAEAVLEGTTRAFDENVRRRLSERIEQISSATAAAFGGEAEYSMEWGAPPVINDEAMAAFAADCASDVVGPENVITSVPAPNMAGEDFAEFLNVVPGAFMFLSSSDPEKHTDRPHHNPFFDVDEDVLWEGAAVFAEIACRFLGR